MPLPNKRVNEAENVGHSDPILISLCSTDQGVSTEEDRWM